MSVAWTITNPTGGGTSTFADLGLSDPQIDFRIMGVSTASAVATRDFDSADAWWEDDSLVTIYRAGQPYFTGRVQETPTGASESDESRTLNLADAFQDFEEVIYQEEWPIGAGTVLYPRCILGRNSSGALITTGQQIGEVIDYLMSQGVAIQKGTIAEGYQLWPSEARNTSCEAVITGEMRFHPDWASFLDHTTSPPTFHAMAKADLEEVVIDIADETVVRKQWAKVVRNVPKGVRIIYESAASVDGEIYRNAYLDEAGDTTGRKVMQAMLDLEGMTMQFQKSRVKVREIPAEGTHAELAEEWEDFIQANFPALAAVAGTSWTVRNFKTTLVPDPGGHPDPVCTKATRLEVEDKSDLPNQLVQGQIEDWMRKKVGQITVKYDFEINQAAPDADKAILKAFEGKEVSMTITATNAVTKLYKGVSSFTEGEGRPAGLAAAIFAAATEDQYEGQVSTVKADVDAGRFHGKRLKLMNGAATVMPGAVIHSASADTERGGLALSFGPMPYLSAGDFLELQRLFKRRPVTWMSQEERTSNELGAKDNAGSKGDTVSGYDLPATISPPGGGAETPPPFWPSLSGSVIDDDLKISMVDGFLLCQLVDATSDAATNVTITGIPDGESTEVGRKYWVTATESQAGVITVASAGNGAAWPNSTAPQPIGGDELTGSSGTRIWRLCEVVADGDEAKLKVWRTGHIQHTAIRRLENTIIGTPSGGQARVVKKFNKETGEWELRILEAGDGVDITEDGDVIRISAGGSHPWKGTGNGTADITVAGGHILFAVARGSLASRMDPIVYGVVSYAGGTITIAAAGWLWAKCSTPIPGGSSAEAVSTSIISTDTAVLHTRIPESVAVVFSADGPGTYNPGDESIYYPICEVSFDSGVAAVVDQILTHNPPHDLNYLSATTGT